MGCKAGIRQVKGVRGRYRQVQVQGVQGRYEAGKRGARQVRGR